MQEGKVKEEDEEERKRGEVYTEEEERKIPRYEVFLQWLTQ